jgi:hypothetical protein
MSVTAVKRTYIGEQGDAFSGEHHYIVVVNSLDDTWVTAMNASAGGVSIPAEGAILSGTSLRAKKSVRRLETNPYYFEVTVKWEAPSVSSGGETKPGGGGVWNVQISSREAIEQHEVFADVNGDPMCASSGEKFTTGIQDTIYDEEFVIDFETDTLPQTLIAGCRGKVNSDEITLTIKGVSRTFAAKTLLLYSAPWTFTYRYTDDPDVPDFKCSFILHYRADTWKIKRLDEGFYHLESGDPVRNKDKDGVDMVTPSRLDGTGGLLAITAAPVGMEFEMKTATTFTTLIACVG